MVEGGRSRGQPRVVVGVLEVGHIISLIVGARHYPGLCREVRRIGGRVGGSTRINDCVCWPAPLLVVALHLSRGQLPTTLVADVLHMLGTTLLGGNEECGCSPGVQVDPESALAQNAIQPRLVGVARPLVAVQVVPTRELAMAEAAGEPGTRLPPREPLLLELLARAAAEDHGGLLERPPLPVECHAGSRVSLMSVRDFIIINIKSVRSI